MTPKVTEKAPTGKNLQRIGEMIGDVYITRKKARRDREMQWDEIKRQVAMIAKPSNIDKESGRAAPGSEWMPFIELPWQAQTLELLNADARRLMFASEKKWFSAIAYDSDDALLAMEQGLHEQGVAANVNAEAMNAVVEAVHEHFQALYDFRGEVDRLNTSAFLAGTSVGRVRRNRIRTFSPAYRVTVSDKMRTPVLTAYPIENTYLDDTPAAAQRAGVNVAPAEIFTWWQRWEDLVIAARMGSTDPSDDNGGWIPDMLKDLDPDPETKQVQLLEWEGDLLFDMSPDDTRFVPKAIVTVVLGQQDKKPVQRVIRFRETSRPSYITHPYHLDDSSSVYGSSPLMKGCQIQLAASEMFSRMTQAGILNVEPPVSWRPASVFMATNRGPDITPRALWEDPGGSIQIHQIGDPLALMQMWMALKAEYATVTGTDAPRLGQQTKSHQTAYAVDTELQRGVVRTVDYVRSFQEGPARTFLHLEYSYILEALARPTPIYVAKFKQWIAVSAKMLPKRVIYEILGAATPADDQGKLVRKVNAIQLLAQLEPLAVQAGKQPMDWDEIRKEIAEDGGLNADVTPQPPDGGAGQGAEGPGNPDASQGAAGNAYLRLAAGVQGA